MKTLVLALALLTSCALLKAQDPAAPALKPVQIGESWGFKRTVTNSSVAPQVRLIFKITSVGSDGKYVYQSMPSEIVLRNDSPWRKAGVVDTDACLVDFFGGASLGLRDTCTITFVPGMDWDTEEIDKDVRTKRRHEVIGFEEVTVPAGTFNAVKIKADWEVAKGSAKKGGAVEYGPPQRYQFFYWYAPETKTMVRTEREFRTETGAVESKVTDVLSSYNTVRTK